MSKRVILLLLCVCLLFCSTGCTAWITEKKNGDNYVDNNNALQLAMSQHSADLIESCNAQYDKISEHYVADNIFEAIFSKDAVMPSTMARMQKKADSMQSRVNRALANDSKYQQSLSIMNDKGKNNKTSKLFSQWKFIIIVVIVLLIIIFIALLLSKIKQPKQHVSSSPTTPKQNTEVTVGADVKVNYDKLLAKNCKRLNIDNDEILAKHNGDTKSAYEETNLM